MRGRSQGGAEGEAETGTDTRRQRPRKGETQACGGEEKAGGAGRGGPERHPGTQGRGRGGAGAGREGQKYREQDKTETETKKDTWKDRLQERIRRAKADTHRMRNEKKQKEASRSLNAAILPV